MASFQIWGRVEQVDEGRFVVIASAVARDLAESNLSTFVFTDGAESEEEARACLSRLVARLDARVRADGNTVSDIDVQ